MPDRFFICIVRKNIATEDQLDKEHKLLYSGVPPGNRAEEEVGLIFSKDLFRKVQDWEPVRPDDLCQLRPKHWKGHTDSSVLSNIL